MALRILKAFRRRVAQQVCVMAMLMGLGVLPCEGQQEEAPPRLEEETAAGVRALQAKDLQQAQLLLEGVVAAQPAYASPDYGAAAYWLGRVLEAQGASAEALRVWKAALEVFERQQGEAVVPPRLADAFLQVLFEKSCLKEHRGAARRAYLYLMGAVGGAYSPSEQATLRRHVAQVKLLLPENTFRALLAGRGKPPDRWRFRTEAGEHLLSWWRSQDPLPATERNERIDAHLERLAYASRHFEHAERLSRLSDRGQIYLRYGPPDMRRSIDFNDGKFYREVLRFGTSLSPSDFPANEYWAYPSIADASYFLFARERNDTYSFVATSELLPYKLRHGFQNTARGQNRAYSAIAALRYIYRHLAQYHTDFSAQFSSIDNYALWQEEQGIAAKVGAWRGKGQQSTTVGAGTGERRVFANPSLGIIAPSTFARSTLSKVRLEEEQARRRRQGAMARQRPRPLSTASMPVMARPVRFLEEDGTTRTEVYWSVPPGALHPEERARNRYPYYYISLVGVQQKADYRRRGTRRKVYAIERSRKVDEGLLTPQVFVTTGDTGTYHLALQWDGYLARGGQPQYALGPHLKTQVLRFDSLTALSPNEDRLEMSDLQPMILPDEGALQAAKLEAAAIPYPFSRVLPTTSLLLHFEIYHLFLGREGEARYSVEYEVARRMPQGGWAKLFRSDVEESTATKATHTSSSRSAGEYVLLDLGKWEDEQGTLVITVRVTDEVSEQEVQRSLTLEMVPRRRQILTED